MIRIYLDQKDYINIAEGILGDSRFKDEADCYKHLLTLVNKRKATIYYSWAHISETLKHVNTITDSLKNQCEVLDKLTKGNCLLQTNQIIKKEIEYFLLEQVLKLNANENKITQYPFGTHSDCIEFDIDIENSRKNLDSKVKKGIKDKVFSKSKKQLNKLFPNANNLTKKEVYKLLTFDEKAFKKYFDSTLGFKELILKYRDYFTKFGAANNLPLSRSKEFVEIMGLHRERMILGFEIINKQNDPQEKQKIKDKLKKKVDEDILSYRESITDHYKKEIIKYIKPFLECKKINEKEALDKLSDFNKILGIRFYKELITEYFKRNSGFTPNPRKTDINDYYDIEHIRYIPYVDYYVSERFFSGVASAISKNYNTEVFRNLKELRIYLESF